MENRNLEPFKEFEQQDMKYDSTGMFHWTQARAIEECVLVSFDCLFLMVVL